MQKKTLFFTGIASAFTVYSIWKYYKSNSEGKVKNTANIKFQKFDDITRAHALGILIIAFVKDPELNLVRQNAFESNLQKLGYISETFSTDNDAVFDHECYAYGFIINQTLGDNNAITRPISVILIDWYEKHEMEHIVNDLDSLNCFTKKDIEDLNDSYKKEVTLIVAEMNSYITEYVGKFVMKAINPEGFFLIDYIAVDPDLQGLGYGSRTLKEAENKMNVMSNCPFMLYTSNLKNVSWYKKYGFYLVKTIIFQDTEKMSKNILLTIYVLSKDYPAATK